MVSARKLSDLHSLQKLREEQHKSRLARSIRDMHEAEDALVHSNERLRKASADFELALQQDAVDLDRFRILAARIGTLDDRRQSDNARLEETVSDSEATRADWMRAERQSHHLSEAFKLQLRHEKRRAEERSMREFLSGLAAKKGLAR